MTYAPRKRPSVAVGERADAPLPSLPAAALADPEGEAEDDADPLALGAPSAVSFEPTGVAAPTSSGGAYLLGVVYST